MTIELPPVEVRTLPEHILALSAYDRLYYCIGVIAVEWQSLVHTVSELTRRFDRDDDDRKALPSFSVMSKQWRTIVKASPAMPDPNRAVEIMALAGNYQQVRDALIHGTPFADRMVYKPGSDDEIVRIDIAADKKVYKQHVRDRSARYYRQYGMRKHNVNLKDWLERVVDNNHKYELYYSQRDIEYIAAHGLPQLRNFVSHASHITEREIVFGRLEPLAGKREPLAGAAALVMQPLPHTVHRLTGLEVRIPGDNPKGLRIKA
jgi:hypothetical protein